VEYDATTERMKKRLARHPVPVVLIGRLAVDHAWQGKGLGAALLLDALRRVLSAADIVGIRAGLVHAKDEAARRFYEHFDFDASPVDPMHLFLLVKEIARLIKR
jgi:GNAT superfamily N-acetyltransferase